MPKSWRKKKSPQSPQSRLPKKLVKEHAKILQSPKQYSKNLFGQSWFSHKPNYNTNLQNTLLGLKSLTNMRTNKTNTPLGNHSTKTKRNVWHGNGSTRVLSKKSLLKKNGDIKLSSTLGNLYELYGKNNENYQNRIERIQRKYTNNKGITSSLIVNGQVYGKQRFVNNVYRLVHPKPQGLLNNILQNKTITRSKLANENTSNQSKGQYTPQLLSINPTPYANTYEI